MGDLNIEFLIFELLMFSLLILVLLKCKKEGTARVLEILFAFLYGLLLEYITIVDSHSYYYGIFTFQIMGVPLGIGAGWAIIIYACSQLAQMFHLRDKLTGHLFQGLLALSIDLVMDPVATRQGMWIWKPVDQYEIRYFNIPWGNFLGWFLVIFSYSFFLDIFHQFFWHQHYIKKWLYCPLALIFSLFSFTAILNLFNLRREIKDYAIIAIFLFSLIYVLSSKPKFKGGIPLGKTEVLVFLAFQAYFNFFGCYLGFYKENILMGSIGISIGMLSLGSLIGIQKYATTSILVHQRKD